MKRSARRVIHSESSGITAVGSVDARDLRGRARRASAAGASEREFQHFPTTVRTRSRSLEIDEFDEIPTKFTSIQGSSIQTKVLAEFHKTSAEFCKASYFCEWKLIVL